MPKHRSSDGTYVKPSKSRRSSTSRKVKRESSKKSVKRKRSSRRLTPKRKSKCPAGKIMRSGYVRSSYTRSSKDGSRRVSVKKTVVPPACIKDVGKKGKGKPLIGPLKEGTLEKYGYSNVMALTLDERHEALAKAVKKLGWLPVFRKLNAVAVLNRNTNPKLARRFLRDRDYVKLHYAGQVDE